MAGAAECLGREAELSAVSAFLDGVARWPGALVIEGDAGIGKSTVWSAGLDEVSSRPLHLLVATPAEDEADLPWCALGDVLDRIDASTVASMPGPQRRAMEIALLLTDGDERFETGERHAGVAFLTILRLLSEHRPVLLAVDDVEWLDGPSARAMRFALRRLRDEPVGVLMTREKGRGLDDPLDLARTLPPGAVQRVRLAPLGGDELRLIVRSRLGPDVPHAALVEIERLSSGNPAIALEIADASVTGLPGEPLPVPSRLRDEVRADVDELPDDVVHVLLVVAALATPRVALVADVVADDVRPQLAQAQSAGVVTVEGGEITFVHPLAGSALYLDAPPGERRRVHRRIAEVVADPEERSFHLALATDGPDAVVAAALDAAAVGARARGAPARAAELLELARSLTPPRHADDAHRRTLDAAEDHFRAGNMVRARRLLEATLDELGPGAARAEILGRLGRIRSETDSIDAAIELGERALAEAGSGDTQRAAVGSDLAAAALFQLDVARAREHAAEALDLAEEIGADTVAAEAIGTLAICDAMVGRDVWTPLLEVGIGMERGVAGVRPARSAACARSQLLAWAGDLDRARSALEALQRETAGNRHEDSRVFVLTRLCHIECRAGEWARAARLAEEAEAASLLIGQEPQRAFALSARALLASLHGDVDTARSLAAEGRELALRTGCTQAEIELQTTLGFLELSLGDAPAAVDQLRPAHDTMRRAGITEPGALAFVPDLVEALVATGDVGTAVDVLEPFEARSRELGRGWGVAVSLRCRGLLAAAGGDVDGAVRLLESALDAFDRVPMPFERARTLATLGRTQRRSKQWRPARESLERARALVESLGARTWAELIGGDLTRIGGRTASPDSELTAGERQAAELVVRGMTNREVADALFISLKTVEATLTRVYRKLGVRSRAELRSLYATEERDADGEAGSR